MAPSQLRKVYWSHTYDDLRTLVRLKISHEMAMSLANFEALMGLAEAVFGDPKKRRRKAPPKPISGPGELAAIVARMGGSMG